MYFIVFDLETTCWDGNPPTEIREVIEIGAYKIDRYGHILNSFSQFVKPIQFPILSPFCKKLTTIKQLEINRARTFDVVIEQFQDWIEPEKMEYLLCSWGGFDQTQLMNESQRFGLGTDWLECYLNVKEQYHHLKKISSYKGLKTSIQREGFEFEGVHHRALPDAYNLSKIFLKYLDEWMY